MIKSIIEDLDSKLSPPSTKPKVSTLKKVSNLTGIGKYPQICIDKQNITNIKTVLQNKISKRTNNDPEIKVYVRFSNNKSVEGAYINNNIIKPIIIKNKSFTITFKSQHIYDIQSELENREFLFKDLNITISPTACLVI